MLTVNTMLTIAVCYQYNELADRYAKIAIINGLTYSIPLPFSFVKRKLTKNKVKEW